MKNYIYISDSKLKTFHDQMPKNRSIIEMVSAAFSFDIAGFQASLNLNEATSGRQARLERLSRHIEKAEGQSEMWRRFEARFHSVHGSKPTEEFLMIASLGAVDGNGGHGPTSFLLLAGSGHHVIGNSLPSSEISSSLSYFPFVSTRLAEWGNDKGLIRKALDRGAGSVDPTDQNEPRFDTNLRNSEVSQIMVDMAQSSKGTPLTLETLALKVFEYKDNLERNFYIYSPLYVAHTT